MQFGITKQFHNFGAAYQMSKMMSKKIKPIASIYIVDHDFVYTTSLKKAIEKPAKYYIQTFVTGEKFIAHLASQNFRRNDIHIVFLGYQFVDDHEHNLMNGIEILEATKVINPNIEVVMLFTPNEATFGAYARNRGAYAFVPKNDTIFLRINNIVMRVVSQKILEQKRRAFFIAVKIFIVYSFLILIGVVVYTLLSS